MKKTLLILLIFFSCYFVYNYTKDDKINYLNIGDEIALGVNNNNVISEGYSGKIRNYLQKEGRLKSYNSSFTGRDYRITDVINDIKFHESISINGNDITINELLKRADVITISIGMNELYYKLMLNNDNNYSYVDRIIDDMSQLIIEIKKYNKKKIFVLGYYNVSNSNYDIFTYVNYKLKKLVENNNLIFIDTSKVINNSFNYLDKKNIIYPSEKEYDKIFKIIVDKI